MKCLVLAGGFATRLYPLTVNRAKALLEFRGEPVINHALKRIPDNIEVLVAINRKFEDEFLNWRNSLGRPVEICVEDATSDQQKKGAIGAVDYWIKQKSLGEDLMVIAADNYFEMNLDDFIRSFNGENPIIAVHDVGDISKVCEPGQPCQLGLVLLEQNRVVRLDEKPQEPTSSIIATGIYILPRCIFPILQGTAPRRRRITWAASSAISLIKTRYTPILSRKRGLTLVTRLRKATSPFE